MKHKISLLLIFCILFTSMPPAFCAAPATEYLCEIGVYFFRLGRYDDALSEFNKVLILDPRNDKAKKYIGNIFAQGKTKPASIKERPQERPQRQLKLTREEAISNTLNNLDKGKFQEKFEKKPMQLAGIKIAGETQVRLGITPNDTVWKKANWDLNERNYRRNSEAAFNRKENTYDARVYDRLMLKLDSDKKEGLDFHSKIVIDPWSFTGKSAKTTVTSSSGDNAEIELKYWSNTGYAINETVYTNRLGNSFSLPELKVKDEKTNAFTASGDYTVPTSDKFNIPALKIYREFQPVRELWFDYNQENLKLRFFPIAYQNQALTFDDPLKLSNNQIWWEDSPWIRKWTPGIKNSGLSPVDFSKGYWDNTLSFFTRDSEGQRLTSLRGLSFDFSPAVGTSIVSSLATPKNLWQDYADIDNVISATRLKHSLLDNLNIGASYTARLGFNPERDRRTDAKNFVGAADLSYEVIDGMMMSFEVARSKSYYDLSNTQFKTDSTGNAYYFSLQGRYPTQSIIDTKYGYNGIQPKEDERFFNKFRFFVARMDDSFDESLSSYVETRDDEWWGRHLHFRKPFKYYYQGEKEEGKLLTWDDVKPFRIGNGIDIGRNTTGFRAESLLWDKKIDNLFDVRNVHETNGKFVENVSREELTWQVNDKLTTKALGIYQRVPKTKGGTDPFIFDSRTRRFYDNSYIEDGMNASLKTGSLGLEYAFFDWLALNGIWEYTNDYTLGYDAFPRGIFDNKDRGFTFYENNNKYRDRRGFLTNQQFFPKPPYPYYDIFKTGLTFNPFKELGIYLDYTRNEYEKAGQVDDNMNHVGLEVSYLPTSKIGVFFKYNYSRWQDLDKLTTQGITKLTGHHNLFAEFMYRKSEDENFVFQYGEASRDPYMSGILEVGWDPYGGSVETVDTQHIFRLYYRRKF